MIICLVIKMYGISCRRAYSEDNLWSFSNIPYFLAYKTHFFPQKCDLNSNCVLYAEGKYLFPNL
jgi:hypothetical protein